MRRKGSTREKSREFRLVEGLTSGALLSIPLWVCIGVAIAVSVQDGPISGLQVAALLIAVAAELALVRQLWYLGWLHFRPIGPPSGSTAAALRLPLLRPLLLALGLTGTYLHYMFWDVQLQIAAMPSITVFVHPRVLG